MSTLQMTWQLGGSTHSSPTGKVSSDSKPLRESEIYDGFGYLQWLSTAVDSGELTSFSMALAVAENGNTLPQSGQELPLEAMDLEGCLCEQAAFKSTNLIDARLSSAGEGDLQVEPLLAGLNGKFERSPLAQVLNRLQDSKQLFAPAESLPTALTGAVATDHSPPLFLGAGQHPHLHRVTDPTAVVRPTFSLGAALGQERWADALGERVIVMLKGDQQVASLRLDPPHLGPLDVRVALNQDQASVAFMTQHANVRDALELAIPRLRELLAEQHLQLVDVDVAQGELAGGGEQSDAAHGSAARFSRKPLGDDTQDESTASTVDAQRSLGLVDLFV